MTLTVLEKPTKAEQKSAKDTMNGIVQFSNKRKAAKHIYISFQTHEKGTSTEIEIPRKVFDSLRFILSNMADGKALQLIPLETELSTQEAADLLNVSRPFLVKLLEQGKIPFKKVGSHRRIELKDLQAYDRKQQAIRDKNLDFLARQAQELNLGYE